jgi:hypothetical protein
LGEFSEDTLDNPPLLFLQLPVFAINDLARPLLGVAAWLPKQLIEMGNRNGVCY